MTPQIARLYVHVLPVFWSYLWLQLRWIFKRQDAELRTLLISVTKWGHVSIVYVGDSWRAYKKPKATRASWDNPVWESHIAPNMAGVFLEESQTLLAANPSAPSVDILPCVAGEVDAKRTEGDWRAPTPPSAYQKIKPDAPTGRAARAFRPNLLPKPPVWPVPLQF